MKTQQNKTRFRSGSAAVLLAFLSFMVAAQAPADAAEEEAACTHTDARLEVRIFKYGGVGPLEAGHFSFFHSMLDQKLQHIRANFNNKPGTSYVNGLQLHPEQMENAQPSPGSAEISVLWHYHNRALTIMTGVLSQREVATAFYWGDHRKHDLPETVSAKWDMVVDDFVVEDRRNTHSAILLTALGIDAMERGCPSGIFHAFFNQAMEHVINLEARGLLSGHMIKIRAFLSRLTMNL